MRPIYAIACCISSPVRSICSTPLPTHIFWVQPCTRSTGSRPGGFVSFAHYCSRRLRLNTLRPPPMTDNEDVPNRLNLEANKMRPSLWHISLRQLAIVSNKSLKNIRYKKKENFNATRLLKSIHFAFSYMQGLSTGMYYGLSF